MGPRSGIGSGIRSGIRSGIGSGVRSGIGSGVRSGIGSGLRPSSPVENRAELWARLEGHPRFGVQSGCRNLKQRKRPKAEGCEYPCLHERDTNSFGAISVARSERLLDRERD